MLKETQQNVKTKKSKVYIAKNIRREAVLINPAAPAGERVVTKDTLDLLNENTAGNVLAEGETSREALNKFYGRE